MYNMEVMKRNKLLLASLIMAIPTLNGCSLLPKGLLDLLDPLYYFHDKEEDKKEEDEGGGTTAKPKLVLEGDLTKKSYKFTDDWDLSGITIKANDGKGNIQTLESSQYKITVTPEKPSQFIGSLSLKITPVGLPAGYIYITKTITGVTVESEPYDFASEVSSYYSNLGTPSLKSLQTHSFNKHTKWIKWGELKSYCSVKDGHRSVDEIPGKYKNEFIYTGTEFSIGSNSFEKEHVWACANTKYSGGQLYVHGGDNNTAENNVDQSSYVGAGSDLLQIRPCSSNVNRARGNCLFTELGSKGILVKEKDGEVGFRIYDYGFEDGEPAYAKYGEPDDSMKGDIARALAYVYMHYGDHGGEPSNMSSKCGPISLSSVISISGTSYSSVKALLVAWDALDPVSETEKYRNHTVELIQGNRNPFVDHHEWISSLL